jgi:hypothetical protein
MRKRIIGPDTESVSSSHQQWLNVEHLAQVEVSSEDPGHPVESALIPGAGPGWRAASLGRRPFDFVRTGQGLLGHRAEAPP